MIYELTKEEREEVAVLLGPLDRGEIPARRIAVELVLLRRLAVEVRRILPRHLDHIAPGVQDVVDRIPLPGQRPAWDQLCTQHFEQPKLLGD